MITFMREINAAALVAVLDSMFGQGTAAEVARYYNVAHDLMVAANDDGEQKGFVNGYAAGQQDGYADGVMDARVDPRAADEALGMVQPDIGEETRNEYGVSTPWGVVPRDMPAIQGDDDMAMVAAAAMALDDELTTRPYQGDSGDENVRR